MKLTGNTVRVEHVQKILDLTEDQSYVVVVADTIQEVIEKFYTKHNRIPVVVYAVDSKPGTHLVPVTDEEIQKSRGKLGQLRFVNRHDRL